MSQEVTPKRWWSFQRRPAVACGLLLAAHALLLAWAGVRNSATFDEPAHLAAGVEYVQRGDFSIYSTSPPLLHLLAGVAPTLAGAAAPSTDNLHQHALFARQWPYSYRFVSANFDRFPRLLIVARFSLIPLSLLAGWIAYLWARALYGPVAGVAACALYCLNPTVLAHGSLVTTDVGTAALIVLAMWLWWRFCVAPSRARFTCLCLALVAASLCKMTAVLVWPMLFGMGVPLAAQHKRWRTIFFSGAAAACVTLLAINVLYGFRGTFAPLGSFHFDSTSMVRLRHVLGANFRAPLPRLILEGLDAQKRDLESAYPAFLFGHVYHGSHWYYYPAALVCKLPLGVLLLGFAAAIAFLATPRQARRDPAMANELALVEGIVIFLLGAVMLSEVNVGTRYLLPAFPLGAIFISRLWREGAGMGAGMRRLRDALLLAAMAEPLLIAPRFLPFVNVAAGGPPNGWRLLADSDIDWGQSLRDLHDWMAEHHVPSITFAYFGSIDPKIYGVQYKLMTDRNASEPLVAISSEFLVGMDYLAFGSDADLFQIPYYKSLQAKRPLAVVGNTIFIYRRAAIEAARSEATRVP